MPGFTRRYAVTRLVRFETAETMDAAIARGKQLKRRHRAWKINLIGRDNPGWRDLAIDLGPAPPGGC
jgi:putative endonuclease